MRVSSPSGLSILITSAPRSAKVWPTQGPAKMRASSMTFRPYNRMFILIPCFYTVSRRIHVFAANIQLL